MYNFVKCIIKAFRSPNVNIRLMSAYSSHYTYPVLSKKKQNDMNSSYKININLAPRKSPLNCESISIFYDEIVKQLASYMTYGGSKQNARALLEESFEIIKRTLLERCNIDESEELILHAEDLLSVAIENCKPVLVLTPIKRGGVKYYVPIPTSQKKSYFLAMKWLLESARDKESNIPLPTKLAWEILDAAYEKGRIIKKKTELHKQCEENRAYAHYRWG